MRRAGQALDDQVDHPLRMGFFIGAQGRVDLPVQPAEGPDVRGLERRLHVAEHIGQSFKVFGIQVADRCGLGHGRVIAFQVDDAGIAVLLEDVQGMATDPALQQGKFTNR